MHRRFRRRPSTMWSNILFSSFGSPGMEHGRNLSITWQDVQELRTMKKTKLQPPWLLLFTTLAVLLRLSLTSISTFHFAGIADPRPTQLLRTHQSAGENAPFRWDHVRVKLKKEIVSLGMPNVSPIEKVQKELQECSRDIERSGINFIPKSEATLARLIGTIPDPVGTP
ncbi:hypothetical protein C1H46_008060 [Malus baccata]|uniref:Uncharacterized protein n=1 Tax=Malus baccata TaxID=106549 RepID=A0A540N5N6_MALBA|nr:hypothetical protein C1H46_008060 [Malus baccata]